MSVRLGRRGRVRPIDQHRSRGILIREMVSGKSTRKRARRGRSNVEGRLGSIEETLKWLVRLIIGALLLGAMAYALKGGLAVV